MKTQISRLSDLPSRRYSGVYLQQGRMLTDADWNELVDILKRRLDEALKDVIGSGIPRATGLAIVRGAAGLGAMPGDVYVDGLRAALGGVPGQPMALDQQADFPGALPVPVTGSAWVYADVWQRTVVSLEDAGLRDPGLHGADTSSRTQTMVQVKWCPLELDPEDADVNPGMGDAVASVSVPTGEGGASSVDPCLTAIAGEPRVGNYLFRLEVHDAWRYADGSLRLTLKWSSENAAEHHCLEHRDEHGAVQRDLDALPKDFLAGRWAFELYDDVSERHLGHHLAPGFVPRRHKLLDAAPEPKDLDATTKYVRRWDGWCSFKLRRQGAHWVYDQGSLEGFDRGQALSEEAQGHGRVVFDMLHGGLHFTATLESLVVELDIAGHGFVAGDYWLAVVREDAPHYRDSSGTLILDERVVTLNEGRPLGIAHHYLTLAQVRDGEIVSYRAGSEEERQRAFPPLTALTADRVGYDPAAQRERWLDVSESPVLTPAWATRLGGSGNDYVRAVAVDPSGNIIATGSFGGAFTVGGGAALTGAGSAGIFLAKLDRNGAPIWVKTFTTGALGEGEGLAVDSAGNIVLAGAFGGSVDFGGGAGTLVSAGQRDVFVARFRADGVCLWAKQFGGSGIDMGYAVAVDGHGNVLLTGFFQGTINFGGANLTSAGDYDLYVAKFSAAGAHQWSKRFGAAAYDLAYAVATDGFDNVLLTGFFQGKIDFGDPAKALQSAGKSDIFVAKLNASGNHVWSRRFGGTASDYGRDIAVDPEGYVLITGYFQGEVSFGAKADALASGGGPDIYLAKLGPEGVHIWSKSFPAASTQQGHAVAVDGDGAIFVAGQFSGTLDLGGEPLTARGETDIFLAGFATDGGYRFSTQLGGGDTDIARSLAVVPDGGLVLGGSFRGTAPIGSSTLTSAGQSDGFLLKLVPSSAGPITVQQALDQLVGGIESTDIDYQLPDCVVPDAAQPTVRRRLGEKSGWAGKQRLKLEAVLDALLCQLDAAAIPYTRGSAITTAQDTLDHLWNEKVAKAGDTMTGQLNVQSSALVRDRLGVGTSSPAAKVAINGGLHVGGDSDPGDDNLLVDGAVVLERSATSGAAIRVLRGSGKADAQIVWDEPSQRWKATSGTSLVDIAYAANLDQLTNGSIADTLHKHSHLHADATGQPVVSVDTNRRVGIGTEAPGTQFHIVTATGADNPGYGNPWLWGQHIADCATQMWGLKDVYGRLYTWDSDSLFVGLKNEGANRKDAVIAWGDDPQDSLRFMFASSGNPGPAPVEHMRVTASGTLSIGSADPKDVKLHVQGNVNVTGGVFFNHTLADVSASNNVSTASGQLVDIPGLGASIYAPQRTRVRVTLTATVMILTVAPGTGSVKFFAQAGSESAVQLGNEIAWSYMPGQNAPTLVIPVGAAGDLSLPEGTSAVKIQWQLTGSATSAAFSGQRRMVVEL